VPHAVGNDVGLAGKGILDGYGGSGVISAGQSPKISTKCVK